MSKRFAVSLVLALVLVGCETVEVIRGPDGTPHRLVSCDDIKTCYERATEACGGKYQIINTSSEASKTGGGSVLKLLVKCEREPAALKPAP